MGRSK